jgi:imidazolonepropionase-like amidohydrolase
MRHAIREASAKRGLPLYIHSLTEPDGHVALDMEPYCIAHSHGLQSDEIVARVKAQSAYVKTTSSVPDAQLIHQEPERLDDPLVQLTVPQIERTTARQPEAWEKQARGFAVAVSPENASEDHIAAVAEGVANTDLSAGLDQQIATVRRLHEAGIPIVVGSDSGNWPQLSCYFHGPTTLREIELLGDSGLSAMEAIQAATVVPAKMLTLSSEIGTAEVGKQADLVIVRGDPLEGLGALRSVEWTVQRGVAKSPQEWMEAGAVEGTSSQGSGTV